MTARVLRSRCKILLAVGVTFALAASPASGGVPSLDAYAGQALVLGKPHHARASGHHGEGGTTTSSGLEGLSAFDTATIAATADGSRARFAAVIRVG